MDLKQILIITSLMIVIIGGFYYFISPYQNCLRRVVEKIEEVRNKLATETNLNTRKELEKDNIKLIEERNIGCSENTTW